MSEINYKRHKTIYKWIAVATVLGLIFKQPLELHGQLLWITTMLVGSLLSGVIGLLFVEVVLFPMVFGYIASVALGTEYKVLGPVAEVNIGTKSRFGTVGITMIFVLGSAIGGATLIETYAQQPYKQYFGVTEFWVNDIPLEEPVIQVASMDSMEHYYENLYKGVMDQQRQVDTLLHMLLGQEPDLFIDIGGENTKHTFSNGVGVREAASFGIKYPTLTYRKLRQ